jgi:hypothetical protein
VGAQKYVLSGFSVYPPPLWIATKKMSNVGRPDGHPPVRFHDGQALYTWSPESGAIHSTGDEHLVVALAETARQNDLLREAFEARSTPGHCQYTTAKRYTPGRQSSAQSTAQAMNTWSWRRLLDRKEGHICDSPSPLVTRWVDDPPQQCLQPPDFQSSII